MSPISRVSRRQFLRRGLAAVGTAVAAPCFVPASALGKNGATPPSDRIGMGFVGLGGQGGGHLFGGAWTYLPGGYLARDDVQVLAVCDVQRNRAKEGKARVERHYAEQLRPGRLQGLRRLLGHPRHAPPRRHRRRLGRRRLPCRRNERDPRRPCGQGRLLREAHERDDPRRPGDRRGRPRPRPHLSGRHPAAERIRRPLPPRRRVGPRRADRPAASGSTPIRRAAA